MQNGPTKRTWAAVALALVLLTGCGGGGEDATPTVAALAERLGCTGLEMDEASQKELGAREDGSCMFAGKRVSVLTYNSNSARDNMNEIAKEFGSISVLGDRWAVRVDSDALAGQVQAKLGGKVG